MKYNPTTVFTLDRDWFPQLDSQEKNWPLFFVPAWRNKADLNPGDSPLDAKDLRELAALCLEVAEYLEGRQEDED